LDPPGDGLRHANLRSKSSEVVVSLGRSCAKRDWAE